MQVCSIRMFREKKLKHYSVERISDIYLKELRNRKKKGEKEKFLNQVLEEKNIYFDQETVDKVIEILLKKGYIEKIPGDALFGFYDKRVSTNPFEDLQGGVKLYTLTDLGNHFLAGGRRLAEKEIAKTKRIWANRLEKFVWLIIGGVVGVTVTLIVQNALK